MTDPVHTKARELVAAIRTAGDAVGALIAIKRLGMLELPTEEHCAPAAARLRELEKGAA